MDNKYEFILKKFENKTKILSEQEILQIEKEIISINIKDIEDYYLNFFKNKNFKKIEILINNIIDKNSSTFDSNFVLEVIKSKHFSKTISNENMNLQFYSKEKLESSVENVFKTPYYLGSLDKLSVIWFRLIKNHPFINGNKRIAILSTKIFLIKTIVLFFINNQIRKIDLFNSKLKNKLNKYIHGISKLNNLNLENIFNIRNKYFKEYNDEIRNFIKDAEDKIEDTLMNYFKDNLSPDYILSIFIANQEIFKFKNNELQNIYLILKFNFLYFLIKYDFQYIINLFNKELSNKIDKIFDKFSISNYFSNL